MSWTDTKYLDNFFRIEVCPTSLRWADDIYIDVARDVPDWKQTTFVAGPPTPPNAAKRAKLRAKRKKRG
jgi:hypothetical protein